MPIEETTMKTKSDIEKLEKAIGRLHGAYSEISILAKNSPNDSVNPFKLRLINKVLEDTNAVLGDLYKPFEHFDQFDSDDVPTTSDVTMVLSQYMEETERYRSDNVIFHDHGWKYILNGKASEISSAPPKQVGKE
jgi:hypothetical protein